MSAKKNNSISKCLLTPCRQVGLSRKRKVVNKTLLEELNSSNCNKNFNPGSSLTPINNKNVLVKSNSLLSVSSNIPEEQIQHLEKHIINDYKCKSPSENIFPEKEEDKNGAVYSNDEDMMLTNIEDKVKDSSDLNSKNRIFPYDSDEDFQMFGGFNIKKKRKNMEEAVSTKISQRINTFNLKNDIELAHVSLSDRVQLQRLNEKYIIKTNAHNNENMQQLTTSLENDDVFTSTPDGERFYKGSLIENINILENQNKLKRENLEHLKQAFIYKTEHSIEDLRQLTEKWNKGCAAGLNDLLKNLQGHGPIDMEILINNLHIPKTLYDKLST